MSILRKRISAILLSLAMVTAVALPTFADDTQSYTPMQISAESEAFPQAYIEIENGTTLMARDGTTHLSGASVTVYYEDIHGNTCSTSYTNRCRQARCKWGNSSVQQILELGN